MKALIILENGFEDVEGLCTIDILKRSRIDVITASIYSNDIVTQSGHPLKTNVLLKDIDLSDFDFLILPGGKAVFNVLDKEQIIDDVIDYFYNSNKLICAICAAPLLIGKRGYFDGLKYTCFPGCDEKIKLGKNVNQGVVTNEKFILAKAMYYSVDFALEIIKRVQGKKQMEIIEASIKGEK